MGNSNQRRGGGLALHFSCWDQAEASRTVGGSATPVARMARLAAGRGAERTMKRLPSCSMSVSVSALRSAMMSDQDAARLSAAILSSNAFFNTRAKKLQNT